MEKKWFYALMTVIIGAAIIARLIPLLEYRLIGDDLGRHLYLLDELITNGRFSRDFPGWGENPSFVGTYSFFGLFKLLLGTPTVETFAIGAPITAVLTIPPVALLSIEIFQKRSESDKMRIALIASSLLAVSFTFVGTTSRPIKADLGFVLFAYSLLFIYKSYRDKRFLPLLILASLALVLTHHLTTYFLLICVIAISFLRELSNERTELKKVRVELTFLGCFLPIIMLFWFWGTPRFGDGLLNQLTSFLLIPWWSPLIVGAAFLLLLPLTIRLKRKIKIKIGNRKNGRPEMGRAAHEGHQERSLRSIVIIALSLFSLALILLISLTVIPMPDSGLVLPPSAVLWGVPSVIALSIGLTGIFLCKEKFLVYLAVAPIISVIVALLTQIQWLWPYRHLEYIAIPAFILAGLTYVMVREKVKRKKMLVAFFVSLIVLCGLTVYPPFRSMRAYDDGFTYGEMEAIYWIKNSGEIAPQEVIAAGLGESALIMGIARHENVTWNKAYWIFVAESYEECREEIEELNIRYIFISKQDVIGPGPLLYSEDSASTAGMPTKISQPAFEKFFLDGEHFDLVYSYRGLDKNTASKDGAWIFEVLG